MAVPNFPQTLPANTVVGRLSGANGEAEVITVAELATLLTPHFKAFQGGAQPAAETPFSGSPAYPAEIPADTVIGRLSSTAGATQTLTFLQLGLVVWPLIVLQS